MGFAKYLEDNYEMFLDRIEGQGDTQISIPSTMVSINVTPVVRIIKTPTDMDKLVKCKDCEEYFVLKAGERRFFKKNNLCEPKRCKKCRDVKRQKAS